MGAESIPRPARGKFKRHAALFAGVNIVILAANLILWPGNLVFYYLTIPWSIILADNFLWAYVVDPDRDVAERDARRSARAVARAATLGKQASDEDEGQGEKAD